MGAMSDGRYQRQPDIVLHLSTSPSTNALWTTVGGARRRSPAYRAWLKLAMQEAQPQMVAVQPIPGLFWGTIYVPDSSTRDSDNWFKAPFDLCQHVRAVNNDSGLRDPRIVRDGRRGGIAIALWDIGGPVQKEFWAVPERKPRRASRMRAKQGELRVLTAQGYWRK